MAKNTFVAEVIFNEEEGIYPVQSSYCFLSPPSVKYFVVILIN